MPRSASAWMQDSAQCWLVSEKNAFGMVGKGMGPNYGGSFKAVAGVDAKPTSTLGDGFGYCYQYSALGDTMEH